MGALFPALFACLVYPATGLNPKPRRFAGFLGALVLEAMSAQVRGCGGAGLPGQIGVGAKLAARASSPGEVHGERPRRAPQPPLPLMHPPPRRQALGLAVGAAAPSTEAALAIGPAVILVSIVFGGGAGVGRGAGQRACGAVWSFALCCQCLGLYGWQGLSHSASTDSTCRSLFSLLPPAPLQASLSTKATCRARCPGCPPPRSSSRPSRARASTSSRVRGCGRGGAAWRVQCGALLPCTLHATLLLSAAAGRLWAERHHAAFLCILFQAPLPACRRRV